MSDGLLKKAVSDDKWDKAFKTTTPINGECTINDLSDYARFHNKNIHVLVSPETMDIWIGESDGETTDETEGEK